MFEKVLSKDAKKSLGLLGQSGLSLLRKSDFLIIGQKLKNFLLMNKKD